MRPRRALGLRGPQRGDARPRGWVPRRRHASPPSSPRRSDRLDLSAACRARRSPARAQGSAASTSTRTPSRRQRAQRDRGGSAALRRRRHRRRPPTRARTTLYLSGASAPPVAALFAGSARDACRRERVGAEDGLRGVVEGHRGNAARDPRGRAPLRRRGRVAAVAAPELEPRLPRARACRRRRRAGAGSARWRRSPTRSPPPGEPEGFHRAAAEVYRA